MNACGPDAGRVKPVIDRNRCGAERRCVEVCPYGVFAIGVLDAAQRQGLSLRGRIKAWVHGGKQAMTPNADACHACGLCVAACPEKAITLQPVER